MKNKKKLNVGIIGISGKMGKSLSSLISLDDSFFLVGGIRKKTTEKNSTITQDIFNLANLSDVLIDFSSTKILDPLLNACKKYKKPLVIGTTGYTKKQLNQIKEYSKKIPLLYSSNFSLGIYILKIATKIASKMANKNFSIKIKESHHKEKKDKPSGTAIFLQKEIFNTINKKVPIRSFRKNNIIGKHKILFSNSDEEFEITHIAKSRKIFAKNALLSAKFLHKKPAKFYSLEDLFK